MLPLVIAAGCGGTNMVSATGVVTWNGKPVNKAELTFIPSGQEGPSAIATTDAEGRFALRTVENEGIVPGTYKVVVQKTSVAEMDIPNPLPKGMGFSDYLRANNILAYAVLPSQYSTPEQTPITVDIVDGEPNDFEIKLQGSPPPKPKVPAGAASPFG